MCGPIAVTAGKTSCFPSWKQADWEVGVPGLEDCPLYIRASGGGGWSPLEVPCGGELANGSG